MVTSAMTIYQWKSDIKELDAMKVNDSEEVSVQDTDIGGGKGGGG